MRIGRKRARSTLSDTVSGSVARSRNVWSQGRFPRAIAFCPASFERCMYRLLEFLEAYWEEFRRPGESNLPAACQRFINVARASLRSAAAVAPRQNDDRSGAEADGRAASLEADQFVDVLDRAIDARRESKRGEIQLAIDALKLASCLVKEIPWGRLPERTHARNYDMLKWTVRRIRQMREGWNDRNYARTVRKLLRVDPGILELLAKELH